ncbi:Calcium-binding EF hand family protein [Melia azedarach]|uniref:Calcium-binding EF hand family protein n=1 Tax=Melia azedarach TaxID=155640 RepID=A0ACC1YCD3_MELAZ|nr:Calcium-binding EF hand family protein [Melia azedarach]
MGQIFDKLNGKQWRQKQIRLIAAKVYDLIKIESAAVDLTFPELYVAVFRVYNDINKYLPGPHLDPPSEERVRAMMEECDLNLDRVLDREEFVKFIELLTADTIVVVSRGLIMALVVAPILAIATKKATEGVPGVGMVVQKLPNSIYASLVTLAVVCYRNFG